MTSITAIIITNADWFHTYQHLTECLKTLDWCTEVLLLVNRVTPEFKAIAREYKAQIIVQSGNNFAEWRSQAIPASHYDWLLYIDTDERVSQELRNEIRQTLALPKPKSGYAIPRLNYIFNYPMKHGGWWPDYVLRLIYKPHLLGYHGELHEQPDLKGPTGHLTQPLLHYKHDNLDDMVTKTNTWSNTEADLLFSAHHPPMNTRRFARPIITEILRRLFLKRGLMDGTPGLIDGIYQGFSRFITYAKLWELQTKSPA